jgi:RNA 2',3'-cyclic 3'-phosphodiesterase
VTTAASVDGRERLRLFCALRLPDDVVRSLVRWQRRHLRGGAGRIVPGEHLHVTLAFLGSVPVARAGDAVAALRDASAAAGPIDLELSKRGFRETRSVAMLVFDDLHGTATALADDLFTRLEALELYERERRPWLPHVTVLRFRERPSLDPPLPALPRFSPSEAAVYHSVLRSTGAQYEIVESVVLGG